MIQVIRDPGEKGQRGASPFHNLIWGSKSALFKMQGSCRALISKFKEFSRTIQEQYKFLRSFKLIELEYTVHPKYQQETFIGIS